MSSLESEYSPLKRGYAMQVPSLVFFFCGCLVGVV
jgi:hypothetical protein